jgi:hypothetical protein
MGSGLFQALAAVNIEDSCSEKEHGRGDENDIEHG